LSIRESGRSLAGVLKRARVAIWTHGDKRKRRNAAAVLDDIEHNLNNSPDNTAQAIARIEKIFGKAISYATNAEATLRASDRALQKKAPFHNGRNNFADALILELYGQLVQNGKGRCVFVTHNVKDFSATNADQRLPHPDIAQHFSRIKSRYFIKLIDALRNRKTSSAAGDMPTDPGKGRLLGNLEVTGGTAKTALLDPTQTSAKSEITLDAKLQRNRILVLVLVDGRRFWSRRA
jgi:hypothetical protein